MKPDLSVDTMLKRHVLYVLDIVDGNREEACKLLKISRSTLYRWLDRWRIK